ncbi:MAG: hypothetical protein RLZZ156_1097 [Deinococcota bacterium]
MSKSKSPIAIVVSVLLAVLGFFWQQSQSSLPSNNPASVASSAGLVVKNQRIIDQNGKLVFVGDVDLAPTLARIARGERDSHPNDGSVHRNREKKLPLQSDNYYLEYVVRTPNLRGVGPQRVVLGKNKEIFYTPNHYQTFLKLR